MALREKDILEIFRTLGNWMVQRKCHADIIVDGGCALVLQTHFRETAKDIDMRFKSVISDEKTGGGKAKNHLSVRERSRLFEEFHAAHENYPIDAYYESLFADSEVLETAAFASFLNDDEHGVTIHLVTPERILEKKILRLSTWDDMPSELLIGYEHETEKEIRDGYALSIILSGEWIRTPLSEDYDEAPDEDALAFAKPEWDMIRYPPEGDCSQLESLAQKGRKQISYQRISLG
jgi:hypothetical protein